jgi:cytochrome oxidase Cu insertion factor (SCO1/SenC/PrrC family)
VKLLGGVGLAAGLLAAAAAFFYYDSGKEPRSDAPRLMNELMAGKVPVGGAFTLNDPGGKPRSLEEFRGKIVLLYFGYTACPDVCPADLATIGAMLRSLGPAGAAVQPLFVTLDPERDTPAVLREYAAAFHPRLIALRGTDEETRRVATAYKVFYEKVPQRERGSYLIDHAALTFLIDRKGRYVAFFPPGTTAERMAAMVREALTPESGSDPD